MFVRLNLLSYFFIIVKKDYKVYIHVEIFYLFLANCAPPVGSYDVSTSKQVAAVTFQKSERWTKLQKGKD